MISRQSSNKLRKTKSLNTQRDHEGMRHRSRAQLLVITHSETGRKQN